MADDVDQFEGDALVASWQRLSHSDPSAVQMNDR
jgi:hypothetical protein